jgi:ubiquinone/menaquinone biosynthesis C-methylase UbiE
MNLNLVSFEEIYFKVREKEGRIYSDLELKELPNTNPSHPYHREWKIRKYSSLRLVQYLKSKQRSLKILEIGCGNGWLSHRISEIYGSDILGLDPHEHEILQANRVFNKPNLRFIYGELDRVIRENFKFDILIFAASIQYFPSLKDVLKECLGLLFSGGEIHILDSPLYSSSEIPEARGRTQKYYEDLGFPEMAHFYYPPNKEELKGFTYKVLFNPHSIWNQIGRKEPFYWISISNTQSWKIFNH